MQTLSPKGWEPKEGIVGVVGTWAELCKQRRTHRAVLMYRTSVCEVITNVMRGHLTGDKAINQLCLLKEGREFEYTLTPENGTYVFQQACIEAFTESADPKKSKKPLGLVAQRLVELLTNPDYFPDFEEGFELVQSVPILNVYGTIEEMFLKLSRDA